MAEEIRKQLIASAAKSLDAETKERLLDAVLKNEDLLFEWNILTSAVGDDMGSIVIRKLAELYITIRGFAFASSCLELYKQQHRKRTQKSKSLRKLECLASTYTPAHTFYDIMLQMTRYALNEKHNEYA